MLVTELVAIRPPEPLATFLADGGYLPRGMPMLKRVLALPGQTVCRDDLTITVDGIEVGEARERDSRGRPLPVWQGCRVVAEDEVFLMNWQSAGSLDGRYFGVLPTAAIIGRAEPLFTIGERLTVPTSRKRFGDSFVQAGTRTIPPSRPAVRAASRAQRRSKAAVRPARQRLTLDGREHDGKPSIATRRCCAW